MGGAVSVSAEPGLTDSVEYAALFDFVTDAPGALVRLAAAAEVQAAADELVLRLVQDGRRSGHTWRELGAALGVSLQAAQQLHARAKRRR